MAGPKKPCEPARWSNTNMNWPKGQVSGFHAGTGDRKIGSMVPNAIASTTYAGTMKKIASQATPGRLSSAPKNPDRAGRSGSRATLGTRLEPLPDRLPLGVHRRRQLQGAKPGGEVPLQHGCGLEVRRDLPILDQLGRGEGDLRRLVPDEAEVGERVVRVEHEVEEQVGGHRVLPPAQNHHQVVVHQAL